MTKLTSINACDYTLEDKSGKISAIWIFSYIFWTTLPIKHSFKAIAWIRSDETKREKFNIKIRDYSTKEKIAETWDIEINLKDNIISHIIVNFNNVEFTKSWLYTIDVFKNKKILGSGFFTVKEENNGKS